jgi:diacylglycerol O-acyltransferase
MYPASIVFDGFAMNITLVSYRKQLDFGIVACRRSMPQVQRIIDYLEDSLQELEELAGLRSVAPAAKARVRRKAAAAASGKKTAATDTKTKTKTKTRTKAKAKTAKVRRSAVASVKPKLAKRGPKSG